MKQLMALRKPFRREGSPRWYYEIDRKRISLGTEDRGEALRLFAEIKRQYLAGKLARIHGDCRKTLEDFRTEFLDWSEQNQPRSTYRANRLALDKLMAETGDKVRLDAISRRDTDRLITTARKAKLTTATINCYLRHIRAVLAKAVEWKYLPSHPLAGMKELPAETRKPRFLTAGEVATVLHKVDDIDLRRLVAAYLATGRRRTEMLALTWEDVNLERGVYLIRSSTAKRGKGGLYPINAAFRSVLLAIGEGKGRVFPRWSGPDTITHMVKKVLIAAGRPDMRLHDLRHSFAVAFVEAGGDLRTLQSLLGHTRYQTTEIYTHVTDDHLAKAANMVRFGPLDLFGKKGD